MKSSDCTQQREPNSGANKCVNLNSISSSKATNGPSSRFSVWDILSDDSTNNNNNSDTIDSNSNQIKIPVDCFCNKTVNFLTPISFHLIGGQATLNFTIDNMRPNEDFNDYAFEAFYEFLSTSNDLFQHKQQFVQLQSTRTVQIKQQQQQKSQPRNYTLTTYSLTVPSNYSLDYYQEFKQRKRLIGKQNENVLINVPNGFLWKNSALRTCSQLSRLVIYWILPSTNAALIDNNHAIATICIEPYRDQTGGLDSLSLLDSASGSGTNKQSALNSDQMQLSFELSNQSNLNNYQTNNNNYMSNHVNNQLNQLLNTRTLRFYANNTIDKIDLVIELIATSKGQFRFDWLQSISKQGDQHATKFHSSMRTSEPNQTIKPNYKSNNANDSNDTKCIAYCPEDSNLCLKQDSLCDQISHCLTSGWDESPLICEAKEQNRLAHFLSIIQTEQQQNKIDKIITLNDGLFKSNWFILFSSCTILLTLFLVAYLIVFVRRRNKHHQSMTSGNFPSAHLQIGCNSLHTGTLQTGSASSTFSNNSSLTNSSCTNSMLCEKRLKKLKQKMSSKEQLKQQQKQQQQQHLQTANALSLMRSSLEDNNHFNPLIPSFGTTVNSTTIHQQINQQPADYVSTSEFQFELNQDRLNNYDRDCLDKQNDFSPLYKKIDVDEYSLKQQHIYYQPSYTTLQRNRLDSNHSRIEPKRFDQIDTRFENSASYLDRPPLPPLPASLSSAYHSNNSKQQDHETFGGLRSHTTQLNTSHLTNLNNHHTIARQSLLESNQVERLLMSTPIYEIATSDRQQQQQPFNNNSVQSMHRSALLRAAGRRFS